MNDLQKSSELRLAKDAGIAIGPILFIIAILGILAAAIAAGSGSFTGGTQNEGNSTKASAMIQVGENLKIGMDRILLDNGIDFNNIVIAPANTSNNTDLFSPSGGGIAIPSTTLANDPQNDLWQYPTASIPQMGSTAPERLAMIRVSQGVCDQINLKANASNILDPSYDSGTFPDPVGNNDLGNLIASSDWPDALYGRMVGCVQSGGNYYFFQILAIQ